MFSKLLLAITSYREAILFILNKHFFRPKITNKEKQEPQIAPESSAEEINNSDSAKKLIYFISICCKKLELNKVVELNICQCL